MKKLSILPITMRKQQNACNWENISHGSESDIGSISVIIISIKELLIDYYLIKGNSSLKLTKFKLKAAPCHMNLVCCI